MPFPGWGSMAPSRAATLAIIGLSLPEAFAALAPRHDDDVRAALAQRYRTAFLELRRDPALHEPLFEGVGAAIEAFGEREDLVLGIATEVAARLDRLFARGAWAGRFQTRRRADIIRPSRTRP